MRLLFTALFYFISGCCFGQNLLSDTIVRLNNYTVHYSQTFLQPLEVWYKVKCPDNETFTKDCKSALSKWNKHEGIITTLDHHYSSDLHHHGHMAPAESFDCSCDDIKSTMNFLNCAIQNGELNKSVWRTLENRERTLAKEKDVFVHIKVEFNDNNEVDGARIPSGFFKTLIIDGVSETYYFQNNSPKTKSLSDYKLK